MFEKGLVGRLIDDMRDQPAALPLLGFTLAQLWQRRHGVWLTHAAYEEVGGVSGAIDQRADAVYDRLSETQKHLARNLFVRLVALGEGASDTRRRVRRDELRLIGASPGEIEELIGILSHQDVRLIAADAERLELAHEALIEQWERLRDWLERDREALRIHRQLTEDAQEWKGLNRDPGVLYRGVRLAQANEWAEAHGPEMNVLEREFLSASKKAQSRSTRLRLGTLAAIAVLIIAVLATFAVSQSQLADERLHGLRAEVQARGTVEAAVNAQETEVVVRKTAQASAKINEQLALTREAQALDAQAEAEREARRARAGELAVHTQAVLDRGGDPSLALMLAREAVLITWQADGYVTVDADAALRDAVDTAPPWLLTLKGHTRSVNRAIFSPDGQMILTISGDINEDHDHVAHLWETSSGREIRRFGDQIVAAAFSADSRMIVTVGRDGAVRLWDVDTGRQDRAWKGHTASALCVAFSPNGQTIATTGEDGTIRLWDVATGEEIQRFEGQALSAAFSPDGRTLATAGWDEPILWDTDTGEVVRRFEGHPGTVMSVAFSPDGQTIITAGDGDLTARLWNVTTGEEIRRLEGHTGIVASAAFSPDGLTIVTAGFDPSGGTEDNTARLWDTATGQEILRLAGHEQRVFWAAFSPNGQTVVTASADRTARLWGVVADRDIRRLEGHTSSVDAAAFSPDGKTVVTASADRTARLWDVTTGQEIRRLEGHAGSLLAAAFSPDGQTIATVGSDKTAHLWEAATGRELRRLAGHTAQVHSVAFSPSGGTVVTASLDETARLWDATTGEEVRRFVGHSDSVLSAVFGPEGQTVVTASGDGTVRLWDATTGREIRRLVNGMSLVGLAALSPDGQTLATTGSNPVYCCAPDAHIVRLWDVATGQEINRLEGHLKAVYSAAFSPDGRMVLTVGGDPALQIEDNTVRLWDVTTGQELRRLTGHTSSIYGASFSPDGKTIVTASSDRTAQLWVADIDDLLAHAEALIQREPPAFIPDELRRFGFQ